MRSPPVEEEGFYLSWALLIQTSLLILSLCSSYYLQYKQIRAIHETVVSIFAGMIVGLAIRISPGRMIQESVTFNYSYFFNLLLPPIILNSGYEMKRVFSICVFETINNYVIFTNMFIFSLHLSLCFLGKFL